MASMNTWLGGAVVASVLCVGLGTPATATTMKECSAKYKAAKADGSLAGATWKSFRAANCSANAPAQAASSAPAAPAATAASTPMAAPTSRTAATAPPTPASGMASGMATFPSAVSPKYAQESAGKARMHTCLDQYKANKAGGGNGGMHWIQKGGGYYSECNKKLKG